MPYKNKADKLACQRRYYTEHHDDQLKRILANRARRKRQEKINAATWADWVIYQSYRKYCRSVGAKPKSYIDWQVGRGIR